MPTLSLRLTLQQVLLWIDAHHRRTGAWPTSASGTIPEAPVLTWGRLDRALHRGRQKETALSEQALVNALRVAGTLSGPTVHRELIEALFDKGQSVPVRVAAAEELQKNIQKFGRLAPQQETQLRTRLHAELKEPGLTGPLRDWMARLDGTLRPNDRATGERLRNFVP